MSNLQRPVFLLVIGIVLVASIAGCGFGPSLPSIGELTGLIPEDEDGDGVHWWEDNCPHFHNPGQHDSDGDGVGDFCDTSDDSGGGAGGFEGGAAKLLRFADGRAEVSGQLTPSHNVDSFYFRVERGESYGFSLVTPSGHGLSLFPFIHTDAPVWTGAPMSITTDGIYEIELRRKVLSSDPSYSPLYRLIVYRY